MLDTFTCRIKQGQENVGLEHCRTQNEGMFLGAHMLRGLFEALGCKVTLDGTARICGCFRPLCRLRCLLSLFLHDHNSPLSCQLG